MATKNFKPKSQITEKKLIREIQTHKSPHSQSPKLGGFLSQLRN
jgi:hypothetical protein